MKKIKLGLLVLIPFVFQACVTNKHLSNAEIIQKSTLGCPSHDMTIVTIPSRGLAGDALAIAAVKTTGSDGGFSDDFSKFLKLNIKNVTVVCSNPEKLEAILLNNFSLYKNDELKDINICTIGITNSTRLVNEAKRTGATVTFVQ
ncbi:hypothetical protein [Sulfurimonas sp. HSL3-2]|uniref:hypothetical protein n=1 Tax=Hydrocurvibacter mobilis TaxID=3131936 RepID=UPI0031F98965